MPKSVFDSEGARMTSKAFIVPILPRWADIDLNQHMRHSAFADWAAFARMEWLSANGFTIKKLMEQQMAPILFEERTRYRKEILLGEQVHIELQLAGANRDGSHQYECERNRENYKENFL